MCLVLNPPQRLTQSFQHRTPSVDYVAVNQGTPVLITPKTAFSANNDQADYEETIETLLRPGDVAVQRGAMHSYVPCLFYKEQVILEHQS